jgi:hypothetical protein
MLFRCFQTYPIMQKKMIFLGMHITGYVYSASYFCKQEWTMQKEAIGSGKGGGGGRGKGIENRPDCKGGGLSAEGWDCPRSPRRSPHRCCLH